MIIATEKRPKAVEFEKLLQNSTDAIMKEAKSKQSYYLSREGLKFEEDVFSAMTRQAKRTPFEGHIKLVSGHRFPDIIAMNYYGVEVKTSKQSWKSTGNSVLETTRVEDVDRIYVMFAKLKKPVEVRFKPYENCLCEVAVTHSPRYLIDMELSEEETIFFKMSMPYEHIRKLDNPIKPFMDYYRKKLKEGEELWWLEGTKGEGSVLPPTIRLWNNLDSFEQRKLIVKALALFPEILGKTQKKFNRLSIWLVREHGIVHPNTRDSFTAGGQCEIKVGRRTFMAPKIFEKLSALIPEVLETVKTLSEQEAKHYWGSHFTGYGSLASQWVNAIAHEAEGTVSEGFDVSAFIRERTDGQ